MLRLVLALLALLLSSLAAAQDARDPIVITGVVRDMSGMIGPYGDRAFYSQSFRLAAWRKDDGPVQTIQMWVSIKADTPEELQALEKQFPAKRLIRFEASGDISFRGGEGRPQSAEVEWARMLEPVEDAEVSAAANSIFNPAAFDDPEFGTFEPHSSIPEYFGQMREWLGEETVFEVILEPLGPDARELALAMARLAWKEREAIDAEIREAVTEGVYGDRPADLQVALVDVDGETTAVDEDEGPKLTREEFRTDHKLNRVSCSAQGYCDFHYAVQNDEWYWSYRATIMRREDGGWYLDGWDFP